MRWRFVPPTNVRWWTRACLWSAVATLALLVVAAALSGSRAVLLAIVGIGFLVEMIELKMLLLAQANRDLRDL